jgi:hypothetical protein
MSLPEDVTDGFYTEPTWRQLQHERHQRFLTQLKAEFQALRQQRPRSYSMTTRVPQSTASAVKGQRRDLSPSTPQRPRSPIAARP